MIRFLIAVLLVAFSTLSNAQWSPGNKPVKVIVPFPPGGGVDTVYRQVEKFAQKKNVNIIPEYVGGAEGLLGMNKGAEASKDGLTLIISTPDAVASKNLSGRQYDPLNDFEYITGLRSSIFFLVTSKQSNIESYDDLVKAIKSNTFPMNFGYNALPQKELLAKVTNSIKGGNPLFVPYKGTSQVTLDLLNGTIQAAFAPGVVFASHIESGKLNLIAIDSDKRLPNFPTGAPLIEKIPKWKGNSSMFGMLLPKGASHESKVFWDNFFKEFLQDEQLAIEARKEFMVVLPFSADNWKRSVADRL